MAVPNMIVTLLANTQGYARGLQTAAGQTKTFGQRVTDMWNNILTASIAAGVAILRGLPDFINLGVEVKHADARLRVMAGNMLGFGKATDKTVARLKNYAATVMEQTAIDDEQIMKIQAKLLSFKKIAKTADTTGGAFDRLTKASIDLSKLGFGDAETNAVKLARMLQDPINKMDLMARSGVVFTEQEKRKATAIAESNGKLKASDYLLGIIEKRYGGIADASTTDYERMQTLFSDSAEELSSVFLPAVEDVSGAMIDWLKGPGGKKAVQAFSDVFTDFGKWLNSPNGIKAIDSFTESMNFLADAIGPVYDAFKFLSELSFNLNLPANVLRWLDYAGAFDQFGGGAGGNPSAPGGPRPNNERSLAPSNIVVNFNVPVDSVSAGREISNVLDQYHRANGGR